MMRILVDYTRVDNDQMSTIVFGSFGRRGVEMRGEKVEAVQREVKLLAREIFVG